MARPAVFFELIPLGISLNDEVVFLDADVVMHFSAARKVSVPILVGCSPVGRSQGAIAEE